MKDFPHHLVKPPSQLPGNVKKCDIEEQFKHEEACEIFVPLVTDLEGWAEKHNTQVSTCNKRDLSSLGYETPVYGLSEGINHEIAFTGCDKTNATRTRKIRRLSGAALDDDCARLLLTPMMDLVPRIPDSFDSDIEFLPFPRKLRPRPCNLKVFQTLFSPANEWTRPEHERQMVNEDVLWNRIDEDEPDAAFTPKGDRSVSRT